MPFWYQVFQDMSLVTVWGLGTVTVADSVDTVEMLQGDPCCACVQKQITDLSWSREIEMKSCDVAKLAEIHGRTGVGAHAIVAPEDHQFGMARMFESWADRDDQWVRAFRSLDQAMDWLDLDLSDYLRGLSPERSAGGKRASEELDFSFVEIS